MNEFLRKQLLKFKIVNSVEIYQDQGEIYYHYSQLSMSKGQMNIEAQELRLTWKNVKDKLEKNIPLVLVLNIRGILHKKINGHITGNQLITNVLPNAKANDFYIQTVAAAGDQIVSLVRKDQLTKWLTPFLESNFWLLDVRLGSFDSAFLLPFIREKSNFSTSTHDIIVANDELTNFQKSSKDYEKRLLGDEYIDTRQLTSIGSAFRIMVHAPVNELGIETIIEKNESYFQFRLFQTGGWTVLMVFLVALLANYFVFMNYTSANQTVNAQLIYHQTALNKLDSLQQQIQNQSSFLKESNLTQLSKMSFYADRLGASLPHNIQLVELNIQPLQKRKRNTSEKQQLTFKQDRIQLKGKASSSLVYNDWKTGLRNLNWIKTVDQIDYREEADAGWFELEITIDKKK